MTIISHQHKFIFIKTAKTAGTTIQMVLEQICGPDDICSPVTQKDQPRSGEEGYKARNYRGLFIPRPVRPEGLPSRFGHELKELVRRKKFKSHLPATDVRWRLGRALWDRYFKFSIERNPWDKAVSAYFWRQRHMEEDIPFEQWLPTVFPTSRLPVLTIGGKIGVDRVIRFERVEEEFYDLLRQLGIDDAPPLPHAKGKHRPSDRSYRDMHTAATRDYIARVCEPEIKAFGYQF